jgi:uncharacterized protein YjbJ (UPF0337 family)
MKSSLQDRTEGKLHEVTGALKQCAGIITDNPSLEVEGTLEKIAGKVQEKRGQCKLVLGK